MKKTKKMLSFVLSMLLIVTMFPTMAFAKEEAKTWKFGELSLKAGDVLGKDTEIKNDAENRGKCHMASGEKSAIVKAA